MPGPACYLTHHGSPAIDTLRRAIDVARGGDPLSPVTVLVPSNTAGLSARRALGRAGGLVNVRFMVAARLAELIASGHTGKQGPLGPALRAEAIRVALTESPGVFEPVADHGSAVASLDRTFADLRPLDEEALDRIAAASRRGASVVDIYRRFRERTRDYYDTTDLYETAARVVGSSPASRRTSARSSPSSRASSSPASGRCSMPSQLTATPPWSSGTTAILLATPWPATCSATPARTVAAPG
ncbi:MAG: hypothetical protein U5Q44_00595 [Dehalococcoidia bacterium]|nr:hypothetical protein [Dehalococcoidia bacterium]